MGWVECKNSTRYITISRHCEDIKNSYLEGERKKGRDKKATITQSEGGKRVRQRDRERAR